MSAADCIALVTGTSSGIGNAVADALIKEGWTVVGLSRREAGFAGSRYRHVRADLADLEHLKELARHELAPALNDERWRRVGLVNNAAAVGSLLPIEETDPLGVAEMFAVNAVAPMFLMGFVVRLARPAASLRIVNISSGAATQPFPGLGDYGSSKAALRLAGMTLAAELESDERPGGPRRDAAILSYSPGLVDTAMQETARSSGGPWSRRFVDFHEHGLLHSPEGPAREIVSFLAGDRREPFLERRFGVA